MILDVVGLNRNTTNAETLLRKAGIEGDDIRIIRTQGKDTQWTRGLTKLVCAANKDDRPGLKTLYNQIVREDEDVAAEQKLNEDNAKKAALLEQLTASAERADGLGVKVPFELTQIAEKTQAELQSMLDQLNKEIDRAFNKQDSKEIVVDQRDQIQLAKLQIELAREEQEAKLFFLREDTKEKIAVLEKQMKLEDRRHEQEIARIRMSRENTKVYLPESSSRGDHPNIFERFFDEQEEADIMEDFEHTENNWITLSSVLSEIDLPRTLAFKIGDSFAISKDCIAAKLKSIGVISKFAKSGHSTLVPLAERFKALAFLRAHRYRPGKDIEKDVPAAGVVKVSAPQPEETGPSVEDESKSLAIRPLKQFRTQPINDDSDSEEPQAKKAKTGDKTNRTKAKGRWSSARAGRASRWRKSPRAGNRAQRFKFVSDC